jgi:hypothetical protein
MLPPPSAPKRGRNISIRFSEVDYQRLQQVAKYRDITVTALLHYVTVHSVLPRLEREIQHEQRQGQPSQASGSDAAIPAAGWPDVFGKTQDESPT